MSVAPGAMSEAAEAPAGNPAERLSAMLRADLSAVDAIIHDRMSSTAPLIPDLAAYLIDAGGKRVRPMVTLAAAHLLGGGIEVAQKLAAAVEFIHTATLLHDDVVDESALRRGKAAANLVWGNAASVLVGDFLFARAFTLMVEADDIAILDVLASTSSVIAEGEVLQLSSAGDPELTLDRYMKIIEAKTAALFSAASKVGAMAAGGSAEQVSALEAYGRHLGLAFQLVDDALDYGGVTAALGKNVGDDFREGKLTLPVILAREDGDDEERAFWREAMSGSDVGDLERALEILKRHDAIGRTVEAARGYAEVARNALTVAAPPSPWRDALTDLADFVVDRAS